MGNFLSRGHDLMLTYRDIPALLLLPIGLILYSSCKRRLAPVLQTLVLPLAVVATAWVAIALWLSADYLMTPGYYDHVEPTIAAVAWWHHQGHPLYPAFDGSQGLYGVLYGPLLFQITGAALRLSSSILMSKLPGVGAFWLALILLAISLRSQTGAWRLAVYPMGAALMIMTTYSASAFWVRADPYLLLLAVLASYAAQRLSWWSAAAVIGLAAGAALDMKIHGFLYVVPSAVALLERTLAYRQTALLTLIIGLAAAIVAAAAPFLLQDVSLANYVAFLRAAAHHGMDPHAILADALFGAVLVSPFIIRVWRFSRGAAPVEHPLSGLAYVLSVGIVAVFASKQGSGPYHLLPFLPGFAQQFVRMTGDAPNSRERQMLLALSFMFMFVAYAPSAMFGINDLRYSRAHRIHLLPAQNELVDLYRRYPDAVMGVGGDVSYRLTDNRLVGILAGSPIGIDLAIVDGPPPWRRPIRAAGSVG